jgi:hypothetical protein
MGFFTSLFPLIKGLKKINTLRLSSLHNQKVYIEEVKLKYPNYRKVWDPTEDQYLLENYATIPKTEILKKLSRPWRTIEVRARELRQKTNKLIYRPTPTNQGYIEWLAHHFTSWETYQFAPSDQTTPSRTYQLLDQIFEAVLHKEYVED